MLAGELGSGGVIHSEPRLKMPFADWKIVKLVQLEPGRRRRLLVAIWVVTLTAVLLRLTGFSRTMARLEAWVPADAGNEPVGEDEVELQSWAVRAAADNLPWGLCLPRSTALWWLLARRGVKTEIQFGVRRSETEFAAHAWLEWRERALTDPNDPRDLYTSLGSSS